METDEGLTADWAMVRRVYGRFDKQHEWSDEGPSASGQVTTRKLEEPVSGPVGKEETRAGWRRGRVKECVRKRFT